MPVLTLAASGTPQPFVTGIAGTNPTGRFVARVTIKPLTGTNVYIGTNKPIGVSSAVTSSNYDLTMQPGDGQTLGVGNEHNALDLGGIYWDGDTGATISITTETV